MMLWYYGSILVLLLPLLLLRLLWRSIRQAEYRRHWHERLGLKSLNAADIWIHAVSVGEVHLAMHLVQHWWPDIAKAPRLVISCTTPTGRARIASWLAENPKVRLQYCYLPFDIPAVVGRLLGMVKPSLLLVMETEVWPGLIMRAHSQGITTVLVNARMSRSSARGYSRIKCFIHPVFSAFDLVLAQSRADAKRLKALGVRSNLCHVVGSMKFDFDVFFAPEKLKSIQTCLGQRDLIWTIGSSRAGEEKILLEAIDALLKHKPQALICWAPRHIQLSEPIIEKTLANKGYRLDRRSGGTACRQTQVLLIDSFGELALFYALADCVFIGGTLVPTGSQNLIEPALLEKPVISGPSQYNFALAHRILAKAGALLPVEDAETLIASLMRLASDKAMCAKLGQASRAAVLCQQGATQRNIKYLIKMESIRSRI